jgi:hypothetical protein
MTRQQNKEYWQAQDWTAQNYVIARTTGLTSSGVRYWRQKLGMPPAPGHWKHSGGLMESSYGSLDWSKQDAALARETALSRERIRQLRILLGKPKSPFHGRNRGRRRAQL